jgi:hypothetical protein
MSQNVNQATGLQGQTKQLLDGPLKHIRVAALAAVLVPLASVLAAPASAQTCAASGGVCVVTGTVFNDTNQNGFQDAGEPGIEDAQVTICQLCNGSDNVQTQTGPDGSYSINVGDGTYAVEVLIPTGFQVSPTVVGGSAGVPDGHGFSTATGVFPNTPTSFGFFSAAALNPGTGTPGYWKNHPDAWPVSTITVGVVNGVGGVTYTKAQAIMWLGKVGKDKTTTMFSSLVPAILNGLIGNDTSCVSDAIKAGHAWMAAYGPVGSGVAGGSYAWSVGEPTHQTLDAYNNGLLCAPHRN